MCSPPPANNGGVMPPPRLVAVAIDKDKSSQFALKWAIDNLLVKGQTVILIHVKLKQSANGLSTSPSLPMPGPYQMPDIGYEVGDEVELKETFLRFRVFCTRKDVQCYDVVIDDTDVARAIIEFVKQSAIDLLVLGATAKGGIFRFKAKDIPGTVTKGIPDFCSVYVIHKGKISSTRAACRPPPSILSPLRQQIMNQQAKNMQSKASNPPILRRTPRVFGWVKHPLTATVTMVRGFHTHFMNQKFGGLKLPTGTPSLAWSSVVVVASLFVGASIVHNIYKPDLVTL